PTLMMLQISFLLSSGLWLSTFLPHFPNASFALTRVSAARAACGTTGTLTPANVHITDRSPRLFRTTFPSFRPQPRGTPHRRFDRHRSAMCYSTSRLRHFSAGSPQYPAETGSSSYGPTVRFRLLPTPSRDDAVTFSYGAVANSDRDSHPANSTLSRAYTKPLAR